MLSPGRIPLYIRWGYSSIYLVGGTPPYIWWGYSSIYLVGVLLHIFGGGNPPYIWWGYSSIYLVGVLLHIFGGGYSSIYLVGVLLHIFGGGTPPYIWWGFLDTLLYQIELKPWAKHTRKVLKRRLIYTMTPLKYWYCHTRYYTINYCFAIYIKLSCILFWQMWNIMMKNGWSHNLSCI